MTGPASLHEYGDINWNEVWKVRQDRHESVRIALDTSHDWDKKENAARYAAQSAGEFEKRIRMTLDDLAVDHSTRVLDIGAGPGTLAIPLAPNVREITAVEPGAGMVAVMSALLPRPSRAHRPGPPGPWQAARKGPV